ncbi:MAG: DUF1640 domain-containing protein [Pseudomonadota bacterium]
MSATMKLDTLAWAKKLERAGIPTQHAEAQVELLANVIEDNICTKQNFKEFEGKIEIKLKELEIKIVESKNDLIKWFVGTFIVAIGVTATIIKVFFL